MRACSSGSIRSWDRSTWGAASTTTGTRRSTCSSAGPSEDSKTPALGPVLHLVEEERRPVAGAGMLVAAAHFREGRVALVRRGVPVDAVPFRAEDLAEGVTRREADADAVGALLLDHRRPEVLWLADTHRG